MLIFLKLGGSLITDKNTPRTPRPDVLVRLMDEITSARKAQPEMHLLLGHGSGSFGHVEGKKYRTREGVYTEAEWQGFAEVQAAAGQLNRLVADAARAANLPIVNFPPSASAICHDGIIRTMAIEPIRAALEHNLIPLVFGDVAIDEVRGGTIVSTEAVFRFLAAYLKPERALLAGIEPGVLTRWPEGEVIPEITPVGATHAARTPSLERSKISPRDFGDYRAAPLQQNIGGSHAADVTGGMASKVQEMLALVRTVPGCMVQIFSGAVPGRVRDALMGGAAAGTVIRHH